MYISWGGLWHTAWKVSKYGVFSSLYFPAFGLNTEIYALNVRTQSKYGKLRTWKKLRIWTFHTVTIYSDHKPFVNILNKPRTIGLLCIKRLILNFQGYDFKIAHVSSKEKISDYFSMHPFINVQENNQYLKEYVKFFVKVHVQRLWF